MSSSAKRNASSSYATHHNSNNDKKYASKRQNPVFRVDAASAKAAHKTVVKGLESFRKRKDAKRLKTAKQLRSYQRACKKEGYEPGVGASRKRPSRENTAGNEIDAADEEVHLDANESTAKDKSNLETNQRQMNSETRTPTAETTSSVATRQVTDRPFSQQRSRQTSKQPSLVPTQTSDERVKLAQERAQQKEAAMRQRRQRHKLLTARTKKGQPVMKNLVQDILNQLQQQKASGESKDANTTLNGKR